jgi:hypothetical protein
MDNAREWTVGGQKVTEADIAGLDNRERDYFGKLASLASGPQPTDDPKIMSEIKRLMKKGKQKKLEKHMN